MYIFKICSSCKFKFKFYSLVKYGGISAVSVENSISCSDGKHVFRYSDYNYTYIVLILLRKYIYHSHLEKDLYRVGWFRIWFWIASYLEEQLVGSSKT